MEKVSQADRDLFRKAVTEAFVRKFERELEDCPFTADCSAEHIRAMEAIVAGGIKAAQRKNRRKWVVTLLVAAALLLTACTVYAYRGEIRDFIEKVYEERIRVTYYDAEQEIEGDVITEFYTLGYVPEGYVLESEQRYPAANICNWKNQLGDFIIFEQYPLDGFNSSMDSEYGETSVITCGEFEVYFLISDVPSYTWNDGTYAYQIRFSKNVSTDELTQIISEIQISK